MVLRIDTQWVSSFGSQRDHVEAVGDSGFSNGGTLVITDIETSLSAAGSELTTHRLTHTPSTLARTCSVIRTTSADGDIVRWMRNCSSMTKVGLVRRRAVGELWAKSWASHRTNVDICLKRTKHPAPLFTAHGMGAYCMQRLGICAHPAR